MAIATLNRKDQITEVAQNMFRKRGYTASSMRDIAKEIGIEPASLYSHISSKEEILQGICFRMADEFFEAIRPIVASDKGATQKLQLAIAAHTQVIISNINASAVFFNEWRHLNEPALSQFKGLRQEYEKQFKRLLSEGGAEGRFQLDDINFSTRLLFVTLNGTHEWYKPEGKMNAKEIGRNISNFILNGLKHK